MVALPTFVIPRIIMLSPIKSGIGWFVGHLEFQDGRHNITCIHYGYIKHNTLSITEWLKWWLNMFVMPRISNKDHDGIIWDIG